MKRLAFGVFARHWMLSNRTIFTMTHTPIWWCRKNCQNSMTTFRINRVAVAKRNAKLASTLRPNIVRISANYWKRIESISRRQMNRATAVRPHLIQKYPNDIFVPCAAFHRIIRALRAERATVRFAVWAYIKILDAWSGPHKINKMLQNHKFKKKMRWSELKYIRKSKHKAELFSFVIRLDSLTQPTHSWCDPCHHWLQLYVKHTRIWRTDESNIEHS